MLTLKDVLFPEITSITYISSNEQKEEIDVINHVKAFARTTSYGICVLDYLNKDILFLSDSITRLNEIITGCHCDLNNIEIQEKDLKLLAEVNASAFKYLYSLPIEERKKYLFSYDINIIYEKNKNIRFHYNSTPISLTEDGKILYIICLISPTAGNTRQNFRIKKQHAHYYLEYNFQKHKWEEQQCVLLTQTERQVLLLSTSGFTMHAIANIIYRSLDSIRTYKRAIFSKLKVKRITEAIAYINNYNMYDWINVKFLSKDAESDID